MNFTKTLINWYLGNKRNLPWRIIKDPYLIWLSEIILQQTRIAQGLAYYQNFSESYPTVFDLAKASETDVLKMWQGLGYYSRARNLHFTAKYIVNELNGKFPNNYKDLLKLKGVGDYTASAIASICFDESTAVVDGNVYRFLSRYYGIKTPINSTQGIKEFKKLSQSLIDKNNPGVFNQAIMDFGSIQCKPQNPDCGICHLRESCVAFEKKLIKELPIKEKKQKVKNRYFNYLVVITDEKKTIMKERAEKGIWKGLYQFPLIESSSSINQKDLIELVVFQKLIPFNAKISLFNSTDIVHKLTHQHLHTKFWIINLNSHPEANKNWKEIQKFPVPILIANFIEKFLSS